MNRDWNHGHTFIGGAIAGLALSYRPWLIFAAGVIVGFLLTMLFKFGRSLGGVLTARWGRGALRRASSPLIESFNGGGSSSAKGGSS